MASENSNESSIMNEKVKEALMKAVTGGTYRKVVSAFTKHTLILDDSYFDYDLLRVALQRGHEEITNFLLSNGCRVKNPRPDCREDSSLHLLAKNFLHDIHDLVDELVGKGASLYAKDSSGDTPLQAAFKGSNDDAVEALLHYYRFDLDPSNEDDVVHFHIACVKGHYPSVIRYLKCGFDPNQPLRLDDDEFADTTPVQFAIKGNDLIQFRFLLLGDNIDLSVRNGEGMTPLHLIYYSGHENPKLWLELAFELGHFRAFDNYRDKHRLSVFHLCCMVNEESLARRFIESGVNVNKTISATSALHAGYTALHFAVKYGSEEVIELLLENGADPNRMDSHGETPLHLACDASENFTNGVIQTLLDHAASPTVVNQFGNTPLHKLLYDVPCEYFLIFRRMLTGARWGSANHANQHGLALFHVACATNHLEQVQRFLDGGVHVDSCPSAGSYKGFTGLHFAVMYNSKEVVRELLKRDARANARTLENHTALHFACELKIDQEEIRAKHNRGSDQQEIIRMLLAHGADLSARDKDEQTPVHHICEIDADDATYLADSSLETIRNLMQAVAVRILEILRLLDLDGAGINARTAEGSTVMHRMTVYTFSGEMSEALVKYLLSLGADINAADGEGLTPLHVAAKRRNRACVQTLLRHGADPNSRSKSSKSPLQLFAGEIATTEWIENEEINAAVLDLLVKHGSDVNARDQSGRTVLHHGVLNYNDRMIERLLEHGADVHSKDAAGDSCLARLAKNVRRYKRSVSRVHLWGDTFKVISVHVQKLLALGLPVGQNEKNCIAQLYSRYRIEATEPEGVPILDTTFDKCCRELDVMKFVKVDRYTSLKEILTKSPQELSRFVRNRCLRDMVNDSCTQENFPMYNYLLRLQLMRGLKRNEVLQSADGALAKVLNVNLPDVCCDEILKYLGNDDIAALKEAALCKPNAKRKSCDYSAALGPAAKVKSRERYDRELRIKLTRVDDSGGNELEKNSKCRKK